MIYRLSIGLVVVSKVYRQVYLIVVVVNDERRRAFPLGLLDLHGLPGDWLPGRSHGTRLHRTTLHVRVHWAWTLTWRAHSPHVASGVATSLAALRWALRHALLLRSPAVWAG